MSVRRIGPPRARGRERESQNAKPSPSTRQVSAILVWSAALLLVGVRSVHGWTWLRSLSATAVVLVLPALLGLALSVL